MDRNKNLFLGKPTAFQVMVKPIGPVCNLNCDYCYYLEKQNIYKNTRQFVLKEEILEHFIKQNIESHQVPVVQFVWQGGEPTMLGIDYYRNVLRIQEKYAGKKRIENILQTNGTLLDDEWCRFLHANQFLVGISIDGPEELHNVYRKNKSGEPTWSRVMRSIELLQKHKVEFNTLSVVNNVNGDYPLEVYHFLKDIGSQYIQFLPIVEQIAEDVSEDDLKLVSPEYKGKVRVAGWSVDPEQYGNFLISVFDEWVRNDVGRYYVQHFDAALANWVGEMPGLCVFNSTCGDAPCLEHNGDVYSCDHFVYQENYLGNIVDNSLVSMIHSEKQVTFGRNKRDSLPTQCVDCEYRFACNGGCPKNRIANTADGEPGLNYLCEGYYAFFRHIHPYMQFMADELQKEKAPANVMQWVRKKDLQVSLKRKPGDVKPEKVNKEIKPQKKRIGRNEPCPCGSGKKYKNCCMKLLDK